MSRRVANWIKGWLAYTAESESPEAYHVWVALATLAGALQRKVFFDMSYFLLYPNLYMILVGPPGRCKKSTAMRIGRSALACVPSASFTTDSTTRESLIRDLSQSNKDGHSSMTAFSSEFATLLTSSGIDMVTFLTDIYDSPAEWTHKTKSGGTNKIKAPFLNLIGATTPDWISRAMPLDTVGIGLTSRIIFVYQDTPRIKPAFPKLSEEQKKLKDLLIEDLVAISSISGEYHFDTGVEEEYEQWYMSRLSNPNPTGDPRLNGYFERRPMHVIKVAMVIAASFRDDLVITSSDFNESMALLGNIEQWMTQVFANVGKNPLAVDYADVFAAIRQGKKVSIAELMDKFKHSVRKDELLEVLETLVMSKKIIPRGKDYSPLE